jgi:hypothetical protein
MLGWSTWESFACHINSTLLEQSIRAMSASPLKVAGYNWILIDDCWTTCKGTVAANGLCGEPGDRDAAGRPVPDPSKFPHGFAPITALAHSLGLRIGIYTSVSAATCAGYTGAFQHEATDAAAFVEWGFDSIKHDSCGRDYNVHDGSFQAAVSRMRDGIWAAGQAAGRKIVCEPAFLSTRPTKIYTAFTQLVGIECEPTLLQTTSTRATRPRRSAYSTRIRTAFQATKTPWRSSRSRI